MGDHEDVVGVPESFAYVKDHSAHALSEIEALEKDQREDERASRMTAQMTAQMNAGARLLGSESRTITLVDLTFVLDQINDAIGVLEDGAYTNMATRLEVAEGRLKALL